MRNVLARLGGRAVFSAKEAHDDGISRRELGRLAEKGLVTRLHHGWYTAWPVADDETRHLLATIAAVTMFDGRCQASGHSALVLHGLPLHQVDLRVVNLERRTASHGRTRRGVLLTERRGRPTTVTREEWPVDLPVVTAADACVQAGMQHGADTALVAADAAVRLGLCSPDELDEAVKRHRRCRGIGPVRAALTHVDGRHESPGETLTAQVLRALGLSPTPQYEIRTHRGTYLVDLLVDVDGCEVAIEFDGRVKYGQASDLFEEKQREDAIRACGYVVVRIVWADLFTPGAVLAKLREAGVLAPLAG